MLRHLIAIQVATDSRDATGAPVKTWTDYLPNLRAEMLTSGGREFYAAQKLNAETQVVFRTRYVPNITPAHRVYHNGVAYDIIRVADPDGRARELQIACVRSE